ncbi:MAG: glycosyltransferase family 2 protein [Verrucomicrobia bacterium]|nr:glycosyltransferase family 2 protein [Verrucomicrobiota bacterium]
MLIKIRRQLLCFCGFIAAALVVSFTSLNSLNQIGALSDEHYLNEKPIVVVIPSYKNKQWYQRNLDSVFSQNYHNFRVIYIDDASPDGTGDLVRAYVKEKKQQFRFTLIQNPSRVGALANLYKGIWQCAPNEIVANLDGDDWFYDPNVLAKLNQVYADPNVWVTYGQFIYYPAEIVGFAEEVPREVIEQNAFREHSRGTTALRTFYAGLFQKINIEDLLYNGTFFPSAWDLAMMWPILEMAGSHIRFIPDVFYVYNIDNPINDFKTDLSLQQHLDWVTRHMPRYSPIERPYD